MKRVLRALGLAVVYSMATISPASAHFNSASAGGTCPHFSSSSHANGAFVAALVPSYGVNDAVCLSARLRVRGKNISGMPSGWQTAYYYGDPGEMVFGWADDIAWTKHEVLINAGSYNYWGGFTLWP
jgi:hypothetical protein